MSVLLYQVLVIHREGVHNATTREFAAILL